MGIDLSFKTGEHKLNVRAAAIILHKGYVLCDREEGIDWAYFPGGRVKRGESTKKALMREMREELGVKIELRRPHFITESFFLMDGMRFHELCFYYLIKKPANLLFTPNEICHVHEEGGKEFFHSWVPATLEGLGRAQLEPQVLHPHIVDPPSMPLHIIRNEIELATGGE